MCESKVTFVWKVTIFITGMLLGIGNLWVSYILKYVDTFVMKETRSKTRIEEQ